MLRRKAPYILKGYERVSKTKHCLDAAAHRTSNPNERMPSDRDTTVQGRIINAMKFMESNNTDCYS